jgi:hypothetical protein
MSRSSSLEQAAHYRALAAQYRAMGGAGAGDRAAGPDVRVQQACRDAGLKQVA